jgi:hypothetical protein
MNGRTAADGGSQANLKNGLPGPLALMALYFLAELAPFLILFVALGVLYLTVPDAFAVFSDPQTRFLLLGLGAFIGTIFVMFNHDFWTAFFTELLRGNRPRAAHNRPN